MEQADSSRVGTFGRRRQHSDAGVRERRLGRDEVEHCRHRHCCSQRTRGFLKPMRFTFAFRAHIEQNQPWLFCL